MEGNEHNEYAVLLDILDDAARQASEGKGRERHAIDGELWIDQQINQIPRWFGATVPQANCPAFQVCKKTIEATRLPPERAIAELLGAINYAASAVRLIREQIARNSVAAVPDTRPEEHTCSTRS